MGRFARDKVVAESNGALVPRQRNRRSYAISPNSTAVANHVVLADHTRVMQQIIISIGRGPRMQHKRGNLP